jgi:hypothetical protein
MYTIPFNSSLLTGDNSAVPSKLRMPTVQRGMVAVPSKLKLKSKSSVDRREEIEDELRWRIAAERCLRPQLPVWLLP